MKKSWGLFKRELAKGTNHAGVPGHRENEPAQLGGETGHECQCKEHQWVHFSLIFESVFDGHVGHEMLCFPLFPVS